MRERYRMTERQTQKILADRHKNRKKPDCHRKKVRSQTDRQTERRKKERQTDIKKTERRAGRQTDRRTERQTKDRQSRTERQADRVRTAESSSHGSYTKVLCFLLTLNSEQLIFQSSLRSTVSIISSISQYRGQRRYTQPIYLHVCIHCKKVSDFSAVLRQDVINLFYSVLIDLQYKFLILCKLKFTRNLFLFKSNFQGQIFILFFQTHGAKEQE